MNQPAQVTTLENPSTREISLSMFENLRRILGADFPLIPARGEAQTLQPREFSLPLVTGQLGEKQASLWNDNRITIARDALGPDVVHNYLALNLPSIQNDTPERVCFSLDFQNNLSEVIFQRLVGDRFATTSVWKFGAAEERVEALRRGSPEKMIDKLLVLNQALAEL